MENMTKISRVISQQLENNINLNGQNLFLNEDVIANITTN